MRKDLINKIVITLVLFLSIILIVCGGSKNQADLEGVILDIDKDVILLAKDLSIKDYNKIKDQSPRTLRNQDVLGEIESLNLYELTYDKSENFTKGDNVEVWIKGPILSSYPAQAKAKKIKLK